MRSVQRAVGPAHGSQRRQDQGSRVRHQRHLRRIAGLVLTAYSGAGYPRNGIGTELDVIAAVVIGGTLLSGGTGLRARSMIGVFVYGTIKTVISFLGRRAVVDPDQHRAAPARVHRRPADDRVPIGASTIVSGPVGQNGPVDRSRAWSSMEPRVVRR